MSSVSATSPVAAGDVSDPHSHEPTFKGKLSVSRRRFGERVGQTFGKEKKTDSEFDTKFKQVMELLRKIEKVKRAMANQKAATLALCKSSADIGNACADADVRDVQFQNNQYELDDTIKKTLDEKLSSALQSISSKCNGFKELGKQVKIRQKLKLDYDHYVRKVRDLKSKTNKDASRIAGNERKLNESREAVHQATLTIYKAFAYYDTIGGRLVTPEIEMFKTGQIQFFRGAHDILQVTDIRDPEQVSREVEQIGKDSMDTAFVTGYEADTSYSSPNGPPVYDFNSTSSPGGVSKGSFSSSGTPKDNPPPNAPWMSSSPTSKSKESTLPSYSEPKPVAAQTTQAKVLYAYTALDHTEISLDVDEIITVEEKHSSGWWTGIKSNGTKGLFPSNYIEVLP